MKKQKPVKPNPDKKAAVKKIPFQLTSLYPFKPVVCYSIIGALTFILYFNTLWNEYALDDSIVIKENVFTQQGFAGIKKIMTSDVFLGFFKTEKSLVAGGRYRPLSVATFAVEHELWGDNPAISHFINLLLYACTGMAMFIFLTRLFSKNSKLKGMTFLPLLSALLFIAHPLHTEAVTNIKGRDEIMALLFAVISANFFLKYYDEKKIYSLLIGGVIFFLAFLSKENAFTWLAVLPLLYYFFREFKIKDVALPVIVSIVAAGIYLVLRQAFTNTSLQKEVTEILNNCYYGASWQQKYATIIYTMGKYLQLLIFPHPLSHDYNFNQIPWKSFSDLWVLLSLAIWGAFAVIAIIQLPKKGLFSFCFIYFAATFSVVSNVFFNVGTTMSERLVYMSSFAFSIYSAYLLLCLADLIAGKQEVKVTLLKNIPAMAVITIILLGYSVKTIARNPAWKDNYTLFSTDIHTSPNSAKLNNALGGTSLEFLDKDIPVSEKKMYAEQAKKVLVRAIDIYKNYNNAWLLLGNAYLKSDTNYVKATECYEMSLTINPNYGDAIKNIGYVFTKLRTDSVRISVTKELADEYPLNAVAMYYYGNMCMRAHLIDSSIQIMKRALKLKPDYGQALSDLGLMYGQDKNIMDSSVYYLERAVKVDPNNEDANDNLATAYSISKRYEDAINILQKAIAHDPSHAKFYYTLGNIYGMMGNKESAQYYINEANKLDPEMMKHINH